MAEDVAEEPSGIERFLFVLTGLLTVIFGISMILKIEFSKAERWQYWYLSTTRLEWYGLIPLFLLCLVVFLYLLNMRNRYVEPQKPDNISIEDLGIERITPRVETPPPLDLPVESTTKNLSDAARDVWEVVSSFKPRPPTREMTYQDQLYYILKKGLFHKHMVTPEYKRSSRKPDLLIGSEIGIELKEATPDVVVNLYKRLSQLRVEYKQIIVILIDRGKVPHSEINAQVKDCMARMREVVAVKVIKY